MGLLLAGQSTTVLIVAMVAGGAVLGAAWGAIPGLLRAFLRTNEIITSLMLNYVAALVLNYLIFDSLSYWRDTSPQALVFPQGKVLVDAATWPVTTIGSVAIPLGFVLAAAVAVGIWVLNSRTRFGFEAQVIGDSPRAARYAGMRTRRKIVAVMALSGAIAGIGGASQIGDFRHTLDARGLQQSNYGYTGIVVAALARYNPFAVVLVAFLLGGLQNAGYTLQSADFPSGLVGVMQGLILFAMLGGELLVQYRITFARSGHHAPGTGGIGAVNNSIVVVVLASAVAYGTPLLYAALGELLAERSGVLNLGVEGMMLVGAVMGFLAVQRVGGPAGVVLPVAIAVAALAGGVAALILAFLVITLRANQIVSGLALTIFCGAAGLSSYLGNDFNLADDPARYSFEAVNAFGLEDLPVVGPVLFGQTWLVYASWVCVVVVGYYLSRTRPGPQRPRRRRVTGGGGRDGDQRHEVPLPPHDRRRGVRRRRRRVLQPGADARLGRRPHGRGRLDRDRARHLRVLAGRPLPRRRLRLRRLLGAPVHAAGARGDDRAAVLPGAAVRDDDRRARDRLVRPRPPAARRARQPRRPVRARGALTGQAALGEKAARGVPFRRENADGRPDSP